MQSVKALIASFIFTVACGGQSRMSTVKTPSFSAPAAEDQFSPQKRASVLQEPLDEDGRRAMEVRGEFGRGVEFATRSDSFSLLLRARAQFQGFYAHEDTVVNQTEATSAGAQMRRMRMLFRGHGLHQLVSFYIQLGFSDRGLEADRPVPLRDAFFTYRPASTFQLSVGQMKVPFDRQRMMSSSQLQLVERSDVVEELNIDRDIGAQAFGDLAEGKLRYHLGVFGGDGRNRRNGDLGLLYAARFKWSPLGAFDDGVESDLGRKRSLRVAFAIAAAFNHRAHRVRASQGVFIPEGEADFAHASAEFVAKYAGLSLAAQYLSREARNLNDAAENFFDTAGNPASIRGFFGQVGYLVSDTLEFAWRVGRLDPFGISSQLEATTEYTSGVSKYILDHDFKIQGSYTARTSDNLVRDHVFRVQTQFFF